MFRTKKIIVSNKNTFDAVMRKIDSVAAINQNAVGAMVHTIGEQLRAAYSDWTQFYLDNEVTVFHNKAGLETATSMRIIVANRFGTRCEREFDLVA